MDGVIGDMVGALKAKNMWDNLVNVPQGIDRKDFQYLLKGPKYIGLTVYA